MSKKKRNAVGTVAAAVFAVALCFLPDIAVEGLRNGLILCYETVIPSLFPFMFVCDLIMSLFLYERNRKPTVLPIILFSLAGGFTMGAKALVESVNAGAISRERAGGLLCGCINAGPAFLIGAIGTGLLKSKPAGLILFASLSLSSIICILLFDTKDGGEIKAITKVKNASVVSSMSAAVMSTLILCGYVSLFSCVITLLSHLLSVISGSLGNIILYAAGTICEVSTGCNCTRVFGPSAAVHLCAVSVSLCGASVLMQVSSILSETGISIRKFLLSRLVHTPLTLMLIDILTALLPQSTSECLSQGQSAGLFSVSPLYSLAAFACAVIISVGRKTFHLFTNGENGGIIKIIK